MRSTKPRRLLAHFVVPVIFLIIGYAIIYIAIHPLIYDISAMASMVMSDHAPDFKSNLDVIYDPKAQKAESATTVSVDNQEEYISVRDIDFPLSGNLYAYIKCEKAGLDVPLYWNDTDEILRYGAGQYIGSYLPGFGRTTIIAGHASTFFEPLQYVEVGDTIEIDTNYDTYTYNVTRVEIINQDVLESELSAMLPDDKETLVMYSCWPFTFSASKTDRFTVFADRISGRNVKWKGFEDEDE